MVIESIYQGVIQGRIDQRNQQIESHYAIGRDVQGKEVDQLMNTLLAWYKNCDETVKAMEEAVGFAHSEHMMTATHKADFGKQYEARKADLKLQLEQLEMMSRSGGGMGGMGGLMSMLAGGFDEYAAPVVSAACSLVTNTLFAVQPLTQGPQVNRAGGLATSIVVQVLPIQT